MWGTSCVSAAHSPDLPTAGAKADASALLCWAPAATLGVLCNSKVTSVYGLRSLRGVNPVALAHFSRGSKTKRTTKTPNKRLWSMRYSRHVPAQRRPSDSRGPRSRIPAFPERLRNELATGISIWLTINQLCVCRMLANSRNLPKTKLIACSIR